MSERLRGVLAARATAVLLLLPLVVGIMVGAVMREGRAGRIEQVQRAADRARRRDDAVRAHRDALRDVRDGERVVAQR